MRDPAELALLRLARRAQNDVMRLQGAWPARVRIAVPSPSAEDSVLPYLFAGAFGPLDDAALRRLSVACRLMADLARLEPDGTRAAQFELHAILVELFGADAHLWFALREIDVARASAAVEDAMYRSGRRAVAELDDDDAVRIARANVPAPRLAALGTASLARDTSALPLLSESIDGCAEARDALDALRAWKDDLAAGRATFVTARLARRAPGAHRARTMAALADLLYAGGVAFEVLDRAAASSARAREALERLGRTTAWAMMPERLAARTAQMRATIEGALVRA